jgi:uncharacterized protein YdiU (UPF0061 family)
MAIEVQSGGEFSFDNSYVRLPDRFYARLAPTPVAAPRLIKLNVALACALGLDPTRLAAPEGVAILAGNRVPENAAPLAAAYAGHQFGGFVPQLGDGRAILLGEVIGRDGNRRDIQLKGSGPTPFSRQGDGRAALGPVLREYVVSEAMAALGVPTTRALAAVATGEHIYREEPLPGAVLTRVASSHIRVGTFQYLAARGDWPGVKALSDHVIARHYPEITGSRAPYLDLLHAVMERQAALVARWMGLGFIHGVMNTDNMSVAGETIDYGPCAFMDAYHPATVFSSIDAQGRYAYANQPRIAQWNLARLAETLLPLLADDQDAGLAAAQEKINGFGALFEKAYTSVMCAKLGLAVTNASGLQLAQDLLKVMADYGADFTLTFRALADCAASAGGDAVLRAQFAGSDDIDAWLVRWRAVLGEDGRDRTTVQAELRRTNPLYIPRNHLVEEVIAAAVGRDDFAHFETLVDVLAKPFDEQPGRERYRVPPRPEQIVHQTFCGT